MKKRKKKQNTCMVFQHLQCCIKPTCATVQFLPIYMGFEGRGMVWALPTHVVHVCHPTATLLALALSFNFSYTNFVTALVCTGYMVLLSLACH